MLKIRELLSGDPGLLRRGTQVEALWPGQVAVPEVRESAAVAAILDADPR